MDRLRPYPVLSHLLWVALLLFPVSVLGQGAAQVLLTGIPTELGNPEIADFEGAFLQGRYSVVFSYTGATPDASTDFQLAVTLRRDGEEIGFRRSEIFTAGPGTYRLNTFQDRIEVLFTGTDDGVLGAIVGLLDLSSENGLLVEGAYELELQVEPLDDLVLGGTALSFFTVRYLEPPQLIEPLDQGSVEQPYPVFLWSPVLGVPAGSFVRYTFLMVEMLEGQTPEQAIEANRVHAEASFTGVNQLTYTPIQLPLEDGRRYAWQVEAELTTGSLPFIDDGLTEIYTFTYEPSAAFAAPASFFWRLPNDGTLLTAEIPPENMIETSGIGESIAVDAALPVAVGSATVGSSFDGAVFGPDTTALVDGLVTFTGGFALGATIPDTAVSVTFTSADPDLAGLTADLVMDLAEPVTITPFGIEVGQSGSARINYPGVSATLLSAVFSPDFTISIEDFTVAAGRVDFAEGDVTVAYLTPDGFFVTGTVGPQIIAGVPDRLYFSGPNAAYVDLKDGTQELVNTFDDESGLRLVEKPGVTLRMVLPALAGSPSLPVSLQNLVVDSLNTTHVVGGSAVVVGVDGEGMFNLTSKGLPLSITAIRGTAAGLLMSGRPRIFGKQIPLVDPLTFTVDEAGALSGTLARSGLSDRIPLHASYSGVDLVIESLDGDVDRVTLKGGGLPVALTTTGQVELSEGGASLAAALSLRYIPGQWATVQSFQSILGTDPVLLPVGDAVLAVGGIAGIHLEGGDSPPNFHLQLGANVRLPLTEGPRISVPVDGLELRTTGLRLPLQDVDDSTPGFDPTPFGLGPVQLRLLSFRSQEARLPWYGTEYTDFSANLRMDFDLSLPELEQRGPGLGSITATLQDAEYRVPGILVGSIISYSMPDPIAIDLADDISFDSQFLSGELVDNGGTQGYDLFLGGLADLSDLFINPDPACSPETIVLAIGTDLSLSGTASSYTPCGVIDYGMLTIGYQSGSLEIFSSVSTASATISGVAQMTLMRPDGSPLVTPGQLEVDLLTRGVLSGSVTATEAFAWSYPVRGDVLQFVSVRGTFDENGFLISQDGQLSFGPSVTYRDLLLDPQTVEIRSGSVRFDTPVAARYGLAGDARWRFEQAGASLGQQNELIAEFPSGTFLDQTGVNVTSEGPGGILYGVPYEPLQVEYDNFVLPARRSELVGRAEFFQDGNRIAYIDETGFHFELAGVAALPDRIGLPTVDVAYLEINRDGIESSSIDGNTRLRPLTPDSDVGSVVLVAGLSNPVTLPASFYHLDVDDGARIVGGTLFAEGASPVDLSLQGKPLYLDRVTYESRDGFFGLFADNHLVMPVGLEDVEVRLDDLQLTDAGFESKTVGIVSDQVDSRETVVLADRSYEEGLFDVRVYGVELVNGVARFSGRFLSRIFRAEGNPEPSPIHFLGVFENGSWGVGLDIRHLEGGALPIEAANLTPSPDQGTGQVGLVARSSDGEFRLFIAGLLEIPDALGPSFGVELRNLLIGTDGFTGIQSDVQEAFVLFGGILNMTTTSVTPSITVAGLKLTMNGSGIIGNPAAEEESSLSFAFDGFEITTAGSLNMPGDGNLLTNPVTILESTSDEANPPLRLEGLSIETRGIDGEVQQALIARGTVHLPRPFDEESRPLEVIYDKDGELALGASPSFDFSMCGTDGAIEWGFKGGILGDIAKMVMRKYVVDVDLRDLAKTAIYGTSMFHIGLTCTTEPIALGTLSDDLIRNVDQWGYKVNRADGEVWQITSSAAALEGGNYSIKLKNSDLFAVRITSLLMASQDVIGNRAPFGFVIGGELSVSFTQKRADETGYQQARSRAGAAAWTGFTFDTHGVRRPGHFGGMIVSLGEVITFQAGGLSLGVDDEFLFLSDNRTGGELAVDATESSTMATKVTTVNAEFYLRFASSFGGVIVTNKEENITDPTKVGEQRIADPKLTQDELSCPRNPRVCSPDKQDFGGDDALAITIRGPEFTGRVREVLLFYNGVISETRQNTTETTNAQFYIAVRDMRLEMPQMGLSAYGDLTFILGCSAKENEPERCDAVDSFEASLAGAVYYQGWGGGMAGVISTIDHVRIGLFFNIGVNIPLDPWGVVQVKEMGGGLFWRAKMRDFEAILGVLQTNGFRLAGPEPPEIEESRMLMLAYGSMGLGAGSKEFARGRALFQFSDAFVKLDVNGELAWEKLQVPMTKIETSFIGYLQLVYAGLVFRRIEGGLQFTADYSVQPPERPSARRDPDDETDPFADESKTEENPLYQPKNSGDENPADDEDDVVQGQPVRDDDDDDGEVVQGTKPKDDGPGKVQLLCLAPENLEVPKLKFVTGAGTLLFYVGKPADADDYLWYIKGSLGAEIMKLADCPAFIDAGAAMVVSKNGVYLKGELGRSFNLVPGFTLKAGVFGEFWYFVPDGSIGLYSEAGVKASILGGLGSVSTTLKGALLFNPTPETIAMLYLAGRVKVKVAYVFSGKVDVYVMFSEDGIDAGEGKNAQYEALIASSRAKAQFTGEQAQEVIDRMEEALYTLSEEELAAAGRVLIEDPAIGAAYYDQMMQVESRYYGEGNVPPIMGEALRVAINGDAPTGETWSKPRQTVEDIDATYGSEAELAVDDATQIASQLQPRLDALTQLVVNELAAAEQSEVLIQETLNTPVFAQSNSFSIEPSVIQQAEGRLLEHYTEVMGADEGEDAASVAEQAIDDLLANLDNIDGLIASEGGINATAEAYNIANTTIGTYLGLVADQVEAEWTWSWRAENWLRDISQPPDNGVLVRAVADCDGFRATLCDGSQIKRPRTDITRRAIGWNAADRREVFHQIEGTTWTGTTEFRNYMSALAMSELDADWVTLFNRRRDEGVQLYSGAFQLALSDHRRRLEERRDEIAPQFRSLSQAIKGGWAGFTHDLDSLYTLRSELAGLLYGVMSTYDRTLQFPRYAERRSQIMYRLQPPRVTSLHASSTWHLDPESLHSEATSNLQWTTDRYAIESAVSFELQSERLPPGFIGGSTGDTLLSVGPATRFDFYRYFDYGIEYVYDRDLQRFRPYDPSRDPVNQVRFIQSDVPNEHFYDIAVRTRGLGGTTSTYRAQLTLNAATDGMESLTFTAQEPETLSRPTFPRDFSATATNLLGDVEPPPNEIIVHPSVSDLPYINEEVYQNPFGASFPLTTEVRWTPAQSRDSQIAEYGYKVEIFSMLEREENGQLRLVGHTTWTTYQLPEAWITIDLAYWQAFRVLTYAKDWWGVTSDTVATDLFFRTDPTAPTDPVIAAKAMTDPGSSEGKIWVTTRSQDPETLVRGYQFAIGTAPGRDDIRSWPAGTKIDLELLGAYRARRAGTSEPFVAEERPYDEEPTFRVFLDGPSEQDYYVSVRSVNYGIYQDAEEGQISFSNIVSSGPIYYGDPTPPDTPTIDLDYNPTTDVLQIEGGNLRDAQSGIASADFELYDVTSPTAEPVLLAEGVLYQGSGSGAQLMDAPVFGSSQVSGLGLIGRRLKVVVNVTNSAQRPMVSEAQRSLNLVDETPPLVGPLTIRFDEQSDLSVLIPSVADPETDLFTVEMRLVNPSTSLPVGDWIDVSNSLSSVGHFNYALAATLNSAGTRMGVQVRAQNRAGLTATIVSDLTPPALPVFDLEPADEDNSLFAVVGGVYDDGSGVRSVDYRIVDPSEVAGPWNSLLSSSVAAGDTYAAPGRTLSFSIPLQEPGATLDLRIENGHNLIRDVIGMPVLVDETPPYLVGLSVSPLVSGVVELNIDQLGDPESGLARLYYEVILAEQGPEYGSVLQGETLIQSGLPVSTELVRLQQELSLGDFAGSRIQLHVAALNKSGLMTKKFAALVVPAIQ